MSCSNQDKRLATPQWRLYVVSKPNSDVFMGQAVPLSDKHVIHCAQVDDGDDLAHLQMEICSYLLSFFVGPMKALFLASKGLTEDESLDKATVHKNAIRSFSVILESQRPIPVTFANIDDCVANHDGSRIRWAFAMDVGERLPCLFHPDLAYKLNSKRWLGVNEKLRSANDIISDCEVKCVIHRHKTREHKEGCRRVHDLIQRREPPFVLKLTQSLSAVGTNIVTSHKEKAELLDNISDYLSHFLTRITKKNVHLYTTTLILSNHLKGATMALNLFVRPDGSVVFLGACDQLATGEAGCQATCITYADQDRLEPQYRKVLDKIGLALNEEGCYGAVGADIMEDQDGNQTVIDLNVRTPLSLLLYLLKGHFYDKRGFGLALVYECLFLNISREQLEEKFENEFIEGRIVLLGSTRMGKKEQWAFGVVIAGEERKQIDELSNRILKFEAK